MTPSDLRSCSRTAATEIGFFKAVTRSPVRDCYQYAASRKKVMADDKAKQIEEWTRETAERLARLDRSLPRRMNPVAMSKSKIPFKADAYRETLIWRVTQLGHCALENFLREWIAAAVLLTRATVETTAALWYVRKKVSAAVESNDLGKIDADLMRLQFGSKQWEEFPTAINVLTFVDTVDKDIEGFRKQYDALSEIAHPNYAGTTGLFSTMDREKILIDFGHNSQYTFNATLSGMANLSTALLVFEHCYNKMAELMPAFVALCELDLEQRQAAPKH